MTKEEQIRRALENMGSKVPIQVFPASVVSVEFPTCTIALVDSELEIDEVRLKATPDDKKDGVFLIPKVGSLVLVGLVNNDESELYLIQCDAVEEFRYNVDEECQVSFNKLGVLVKRKEVEFVVNQEKAYLKTQTVEVTVGQKVSIKSQGASLKDLLDGIFDAVTSAKAMVPFPSAPAVPYPLDPATIATMAQLKTKAATLFE